MTNFEKLKRSAESGNVLSMFKLGDYYSQQKNDAAEIFAGQSSEHMPTVEVPGAEGKKLLDVLTAAKVIESKAEGRRLIAQSGLTLNDEKIIDAEYIFAEKDFPAVIRKGKKKFYKLVIK